MSEKSILVGFGTLLLQESLGDTIGADGAQQKKFRPVTIPNYRRLFNLLPDHYTADNRLRSDDSEKGAANIEPAQGFSFNGLAYEVNTADLANLDLRERYYVRRQVAYQDFATGEDLGLCFIYESLPDARWIVRDNAQLLPLWRDIVYARVGAYRISEAFGKAYDSSTFLADGKTLMVDFYAQYLDKIMDLAAIRP